jgi:integrase
MHTGNGVKLQGPKALQLEMVDTQRLRPPSDLNTKSGKQVANTVTRGAGKNDSRWWRSRIFKPVNARGETSPHYSMRVQMRGQRMAFTLGTSNADAAARIAANIYGDFLTLGIEGALAKYRPQKTAEAIATIGEYLHAAHGVMDVRPATFHAYARHLCRIAGDIVKIQKRSVRKTKLQARRQAVEGQSISIFTPEAVQGWRLSFIGKAGRDARKARAARISANSIIRQARSLFAPKVVKFLKTLRLPQPLPFTGVEFFPRESMRYTSRIDAGILMRQARKELAGSSPDAFLVMVLALGAGLRRGEIDKLLWRDVDFAGGRIFVTESEHGELKTEDSRGAVDIDGSTVELLRGFQAKAKGQFVISSVNAREGEASRPWGNRYRCSAVFEKATGWLRTHGVEGNKALHTLRKEAGAIVATRDGIFAASRFLRHAGIEVTAAHYADKKTRTVIDMGELLSPGGVMPENVVPIETEKGKRNLRRKATA